MSNTLTPRTDYLDAQLTFRANFDDDSGTDYCTMASLARQLERELSSIGEFQDSVRELVLKLSGAPSDAIDGKGSDAGWEEFTLAEIGQGFAFLKDRYDAKIATIERELAEAKLVHADELRSARHQMYEAKTALETLLSRLRGCGDCDPCIGGRPDQCAVGHLEVK